jgi:predicted nucleotidyltransferase component of viral defense system
MLKQEKIQHEIQLHRLLSEILKDKYLSTNAFFKGGTCALMLGYLDRFSVDLDFDLGKKADKKVFREKLYNIFNNLNLEIKDESKRALQFFLKYPSSDRRNTIKVEFLDNYYKSNIYKPTYIPPISMTGICQTIETMFSHKLIAPLDRIKNGGKIAGRDIYDIHYFFTQGYKYIDKVIKERRKVSSLTHLTELHDFVEKKVTKKIIDEDLNTLLDYKKFIVIRKYLKKELLTFLEKEITILKNNS